MKIYLDDPCYRYGVEQAMVGFFPGEKPEYTDVPPTREDDYIQVHLGYTAKSVTAKAKVRFHRQENIGSSRSLMENLGETEAEKNKVLQRLVKLAFFRAAVRLTGIQPPWGALTGVRPAKLASKALEQGQNSMQLRQTFISTYRVSPERTRLAITAARAGLRAKKYLQPDELSLYVGIPFCPTRCDYCSFVSADLNHTMKLVEPYLKGLQEEIETVGELLPQSGFYPRTLYMGGGTPTVLTAKQLDQVMGTLRHTLDFSRLTEYTVEAGRPDTITAEKLAVLRQNGANRISVNPQTMRDEVLQAMGRKHTAQDTLQAYQLVRDAGFSCVNMDLIAGLPGDDPAGFRYSLDQVIALDPENITIHTLALKKGSNLKQQERELPDGKAVEEMLTYACSQLFDRGYRPYYLYRQKYTAGGFENVGWCKLGYTGLYNICIMEELHTILAMGCGGSTKLTNPATGKVVRLTNPKYPYEYLRDLEKIKADKAQLVPFQRALLEAENNAETENNTENN